MLLILPFKPNYAFILFHWEKFVFIQYDNNILGLKYLFSCICLSTGVRFSSPDQYGAQTKTEIAFTDLPPPLDLPDHTGAHGRYHGVEYNTEAHGRSPGVEYNTRAHCRSHGVDYNTRAHFRTHGVEYNTGANGGAHGGAHGRSHGVKYDTGALDRSHGVEYNTRAHFRSQQVGVQHRGSLQVSGVEYHTGAHGGGYNTKAHGKFHVVKYRTRARIQNGGSRQISRVTV